MFIIHICLFESQRQREHLRLLIHFPDACTIPMGAQLGPQLGPGHAARVSHVDCRDPGIEPRGSGVMAGFLMCGLRGCSRKVLRIAHGVAADEDWVEALV